MVDLSRFRKSRSSPLDAWFARGEDEEAVWTRLLEGPSLDELSARLSSIPRDFLDPRVSLRAVAGDLYGGQLRPDVTAVLEQAQAAEPSHRGAAIALWLWASEELVGPLGSGITTGWAARTIAALAFRLAPMVDPGEWLTDAARREEAARLFLLWCGYLPAGEDAAVARSLWERHDSLRRNAAMQAMLADHQHRVEVTAELRKKAAMEAAARYTHE